MWPGNTADVTTLVPVIGRLRGRFAIGHVCVVADRGMISAVTITALEQRGLEYILGVRERSSRRSQGRHGRHGSERSTGDPAAGRPDTELQAKEVKVGDRRYIVCRNLVEAAQAGPYRGGRGDVTRQTTARRQESLVGNSAYLRRYLKTPAEQHFTIDEDRIAEDARRALYLTHQHPDASAERDAPATAICSWWSSCSARTKPCWRPGRSFTRPTRRSAAMCSATSWRWCCAGELRNGWPPHMLKPEWRELLADLDRLQKSRPSKDGKCFILRTPVTGVTGSFQAVGVALHRQKTSATPVPRPPRPDRSAALRPGAKTLCTRNCADKAAYFGRHC